jgi:hypothetical protein
MRIAIQTPNTIPELTVSYNVASSDHNRYQPREAAMGSKRRYANQLPRYTSCHQRRAALSQAHFGCSPMSQGIGLNQFLMSGVHIDHESYDPEEFLERHAKDCTSSSANPPSPSFSPRIFAPSQSKGRTWPHTRVSAPTTLTHMTFWNTGISITWYVWP